MNRRTFVGAFAGSLLVVRSLADAQPVARVYRIGYLGGLGPTAPQASHLFEAFFQGMRELGYVEGRNFVFEGRYYGDRTERVPALAAELVSLRPDVILTGASPAPEAARRATATIPIVMTMHGDPVGSGLAASLGKPAGNVTGLSTLTWESYGKRLQLLRDVLPGISRVAVLLDPTVPTSPRELNEVIRAAQSMHVTLRVAEARTPGDLDVAFAVMAREGAEALIAIGGNMYFANKERIAELATRTRLPSIFVVKEYAETGGLMAYGFDIRANWRRAASYVDRILKGARPGDLPIERAPKLYLSINLATAKALGLVIPQALLEQADEVIR